MHHECFQEQIIRSSGLAAGPARSCTWHCRRGVRLQDLGLRGEKCVGKRSIVRHQRAAEQHLGHVTDNAGKLKLTFESMTASGHVRGWDPILSRLTRDHSTRLSTSRPSIARLIIRVRPGRKPDGSTCPTRTAQPAFGSLADPKASGSLTAGLHVQSTSPMSLHVV